MHTSTVLGAADFTYVDSTGDVVAFDAWCPYYQETDRIAFVGEPRRMIRHAGLLTLAIVTRFYDLQRAKGGEFFIYPQHFSVAGLESTVLAKLNVGDGDGQGGVCIRKRIDNACGNLDIWPESQWRYTTDDAGSMLAAALDCGVNRLIWPAGLSLASNDGELVAKLREQVRWVCLYDVEAPNFTIHVEPPVADMVAGSIRQFVDVPALSHSGEAEPQPVYCRCRVGGAELIIAG